MKTTKGSVDKARLERERARAAVHAAERSAEIAREIYASMRKDPTVEPGPLARAKTRRDTAEERAATLRRLAYS